MYRDIWEEVWDRVREHHSGPVRVRLAIEFESEDEKGDAPLFTHVSHMRLDPRMEPREFPKILRDIGKALVERVKITRSKMQRTTLTKGDSQ